MTVLGLLSRREWHAGNGSFYLVLSTVIAVDWGEFFLDIALPKTDRLVAVQWAIMGPIWLFVIALSWQYEKDIRHFMWGICMANFAWFMFRTVH